MGYQELADEMTLKIEANKAEMAAAVEPLIRAFMEEHQLPALCIQGYAPYFNDGDACVHGTHVGALDDDGDYQYLDDLDVGPDWKEVSRFSDLINDPLEAAHGSHWQLSIRLVDGELQIEKGDYTDHD